MAKYNKKKLPSRHTSLGPDRAPHRSFFSKGKNFSKN